MTYRDARRGAAIAGTMLFAMPVLDVLLGVGSPGAVHLIVGTFGAALIALSKNESHLEDIALCESQTQLAA